MTSDTRPDRDPNEEPPAKRFKEDDNQDSNEGKKQVKDSSKI